MDGWHFISAMRCARGTAAVAALAANFSIVSLYHNGDPRFVLAVRDFNLPFPQTTQFQAGVFKGKIGAVGGTLSPVVTDETAPPGQIFTSQQASLSGTADYPLGNSNFSSTPWEHEFPFVVLRPGWSFWISPTVVNVAITAGIFWEAIYTANLLAPDDAAAFPHPQIA